MSATEFVVLVAFVMMAVPTGMALWYAVKWTLEGRR
jgi:hypothetical protein